ncbi:integrase core domain-containing protein, partial [Enterococcus faecium]|uniref:integrase core domain-containing protein n=1 Tax=Enterococcus faecium TaxID=1352 RepID=UPI0021B0EBD2
KNIVLLTEINGFFDASLLHNYMDVIYKSVKVEFVHQYQFETLAQLRLELFDYVHWWNYLRLHGTLAYETPIQIRQQRLAKRILDNERGSDTSGEAA